METAWNFSGVPMLPLVTEEGACRLLKVSHNVFRTEVIPRVKVFREVGNGERGPSEMLLYSLHDIVTEQIRRFDERASMRSQNEVVTMLEKFDEIFRTGKLSDEAEGIREGLLWVLGSIGDMSLLSYIVDVEPTVIESTVNNVTVDNEGAGQS